MTFVSLYLETFDSKFIPARRMYRNWTGEMLIDLNASILNEDRYTKSFFNSLSSEQVQGTYINKHFHRSIIVPVLPVPHSERTESVEVRLLKM
jgi:hypothetical protein